MNQQLKSLLQSIRRWFRWILFEFSQYPLFELYGQTINRDNARFASMAQLNPQAAFTEYVRPYLGNDIPKIIWIYWGKGEYVAPPLVKRCINSWRSANPDWDVRVLSDETAIDYVDISIINPMYPPRLHADYLRLKLLERFGGVWVDATTMCHRPLSEWIPLLGGQTGFFIFRGPYHDRWVDSWFIAAKAEHPLVIAWSNIFSKIMQNYRYTPTLYFAIIYALQWMIICDKNLRLHFRASGGLPAVPAFLLQGYLEDKCDAQPFEQARAAGFPLSKLNWRLEISEQQLHEKLDRLGV